MRLKPRVAGWTDKGGIISRYEWLRTNEDSRLSTFVDWRANRAAARATGRRPTPLARGGELSCAAADHPPITYPGCHVFVNHAYKFIYIRTPKAASTSIVDVLGECGNNNTAGRTKPHCMAHGWDEKVSPEELERIWGEYFVFGFVRNPWRRAYSLFKYFQSDSTLSWRHLRDAPTVSDTCRMTWGDFCHSPWEEAERLHNRQCFVRSRPYLYFHMVDQYHCFKTVDGRWATDFIGAVETVNEDWRTVVREINRRKDAGLPDIPEADLEETNVKPNNISDPYGGDNAHCLDAVTQWYACDAVNLQYLPASSEASSPDAAGNATTGGDLSGAARRRVHRNVL